MQTLSRSRQGHNTSATTQNRVWATVVASNGTFHCRPWQLQGTGALTHGACTFVSSEM